MQTRPITLTERVIQQLRAQIADGTFPVGTRLPTGKQLSERYGVSAAVIREVSEHLRSLGMIESRQGLGSTVRSRVSDSGFRLADNADATDLAAIFELRIDLEGAAAAMAARHRTEQDISRMGALLDTLAAQLDDPDHGVEPDIQFHIAVAMATHNPYYPDTLSMGMSGDFAAAIAEGATLVRVGAAIFGARPPKPQPDSVIEGN